MAEENTDNAVIDWLKCNAIDTDLERAMATALSLHDVRLVGFTEATHGTREFIQIRHQLLKFLVSKMNFNILAIEAGCAATRLLNEYIQGDKQDLRALLTQLKLVWWDVEEFVEVLEWLREYNGRVPEHRKVELVGVDVFNTEVSRGEVLGYLANAAPQWLESIRELFDIIGAAESKGFLVAYRALAVQQRDEIKKLQTWMLENRKSLIASSPQREYARAIENLELISQWLAVNLSEYLTEEEVPMTVPRKAMTNNHVRSWLMADNLLSAIKRRGDDAKAIVWAHVFHLGIDYAISGQGIVPNMGRRLREAYRGQYYVWGLESNGGSYLAREFHADRTLGDFRIVDLPDAPPESLPWYLTQIRNAVFALPLRTGPKSKFIREWLRRPRRVHSASWAYREPPEHYYETLVADFCDGYIYVGPTSPTTPTPNAVSAVAARTAH